MCPVCHATLTPFLRRPWVPVHQNLLLDAPDSARRVPRGDLDLWSCDRCGYTMNVSFEEALLSYGSAYENTQMLSPSFSAYVDDLVRLLVEKGVRRQNVLEVGCGKGGFLQALCAAGDNRGVGFDPSYVGPEQSLDERVRFRREFFDPDRIDAPVDAVVCRHVVEHVADPAHLLTQVRHALRPDGLVFFETPALEWILEGCVFWDFFYEHCGYFTRDALANLFRISGFRILEATAVFGDQYLAIIASRASVPVPLQAIPPSLAANRWRYRRRESECLDGWRQKIRHLTDEGGLAVWGAGAKGVTFVNVLDPDASRIACLVDINPAKQEHYAPGTGHRVVAPERLSALRVKTAILMNPNYLPEARSLAERLGLGVEVLPAS
jgi:SAM-dependent methyltransferase